MNKYLNYKTKINNLNIKILFSIVLIFSVINFFTTSLASDETINNVSSDIIESQKESLDVSSFIKEANSYTKDVFSDTDMGELLNSAISGNINNKKIFLSIWNLFGKDFTNCITTIASIIVIIVIHSIIKSISDGLENKSISRSCVLCSVHINCNHNNK